MKPGDLVKILISPVPMRERSVGLVIREIPPPPDGADHQQRVEVYYPKLSDTVVLDAARLEVVSEPD